MVAAHDQTTTHHYLMHYPEHPPREEDPHYKDFEAFRHKTKNTAQCQFAVETGDASECHGNLELHHTHIEFSLQNGIDPQRWEHLHKGIADSISRDEFVESEFNLTWYCAFHHRGHGGVHTASVADFEASKWVKGLIT